MMNDQEFIRYCERRNLVEPSRNYIELVRSSPPSRKVQSGGGNVTSRFPSRKMGVTIQSESHRNELAVIYQLEDDNDVLEYYEQPQSIPLSYASLSGRPVNIWTTPDFLALKTDAILWIEVKPDDVLEKLSQTQPNRYVKGADGCWRCPPGEEIAGRHGFEYLVWNSAMTNRTLVRNLRFLDDFTRAQSHSVLDGQNEKVIAAVRSRPGIEAGELLRQFGQGAIDAIYAMIANRSLYADLSRFALHDGGAIPLYCDKAAADALASVRAEIEATPTGQNDTAARVTQAISSRAFEVIASAKPVDLETASKRVRMIHDLEAAAAVPARTLRRWRAEFRHAEQIYGPGYGYLGLIPSTTARGNRVPRLGQIVYDQATAIIQDHYLSPTRIPICHAYAMLLNNCQKNGVSAPSRKWFERQISAIRTEEITNAREGHRAAYKHKIKISNPHDAGTHGDYPWQIVHIDHTETDVELVDEETGEDLGRAWLSLMFDAYSRRVLAFYLTLEPPSTRSVMMLFRDCVRRFSRLPSNIVIDGGKEFGSKAFETFTAIHEITVHKRPPAQARFGSVIERQFGTTNTRLFHLLAGNTQNTKNVRQLTKSVNPKNLAVWSLERLTGLLGNFCFAQYDHTPHPALNVSPAEKYERGIVSAGTRGARTVAYDETFRFLTMSTTPKGTAKIQPGLGVKIFYVYFWNDAMRDPQWERKDVPVRFDPEDFGSAYARVGNRWVECFSPYRCLLRGRSQKQLQIAADEIKRKRSQLEKGRPIAAQELAAFLQSVQGEEALRLQRRKDLALQRSLAALSPGIKDASVGVVCESSKTEPVPVVHETPNTPISTQVFDDF